MKEHLRAAVGDRLEGADGNPKLAALLDVGEGHVERALADADHLGGESGGEERRRLPPRIGVRGHGVRPVPQATEAARGIDRHQRLAGAVTGAVHLPEPALVDEQRRRAASAVDDQLRAADPHPRLAPQQPWQVLAQASLAVAVDDRRRHRRGQERHRGARVAELLEQHRELDDPQPLPAVLLRDRDARPAEVADLAPELLVVLAGGRRLAHPRPRRAGAEQLTGDRLDLPLVLIEVEIHGGASVAGPGQAEHALGDDVLQHLGCATLDRVPARAQQLVGPAPTGLHRRGPEQIHRELRELLIGL